MYIKQVAERTGVTRKTIYLYESMHLLTGVSRDANRYRVYSDLHVKIIGHINKAKELGFKLAEIAPVLEEKRATNRFPVELVIEKIHLKRESIKSEMAKLNDRYDALEELMQEISTADY